MIDYTKKTMVKGKDDHYAKMEYNSRAISPGSVELLNLRMLQRHQHHVDAYIETRNDGLQRKPPRDEIVDCGTGATYYSYRACSTRAFYRRLSHA